MGADGGGSAPGLFPYGKSGLKFCGAQLGNVLAVSLPVWEEWIEICGSHVRHPNRAVSSRMGRVD